MESRREENGKVRELGFWGAERGDEIPWWLCRSEAKGGNAVWHGCNDYGLSLSEPMVNHNIVAENTLKNRSSTPSSLPKGNSNKKKSILHGSVFVSDDSHVAINFTSRLDAFKIQQWRTHQVFNWIQVECVRSRVKFERNANKFKHFSSSYLTSRPSPDKIKYGNWKIIIESKIDRKITSLLV